MTIASHWNELISNWKEYSDLDLKLLENNADIAANLSNLCNKYRITAEVKGRVDDNMPIVNGKFPKKFVPKIVSIDLTSIIYYKP